MTTESTHHYDIGVDVGGTFTDVVMVGNDGSLEVVKGLTDTNDQSIGAVGTVALLNRPMTNLRSIVHGTTVATNAILERRGARLAVVTTHGFRDVLELQRQDRENIWNLFTRKVRPLAPRHLRFEVTERIFADGTVRTPLDMDELKSVVERIREEKVDAVALCFINAFANPAHEIEAEQLLAEQLPNVYVTRSSRVAPHFREYERMSTTAISAYIGPKIVNYLSRFQSRFAERGFDGRIFVMGSNGGVLPLERTTMYAGTTCLSGPAGGVLATRSLARAKNLQNTISFDMGGTSTDVCLVAGTDAVVSTRSRIDGLPITLPMFAIETVSAGGGSIASVDVGGMLQVGPTSAGSNPGPACYGRGGTAPTVTDALCLTGLLRPETFFGGRMTLDRNAAERAFAPLARQFRDTPAGIAAKVLTIANVKMANTVRLVSVREGHDPRSFALVAFGGAGPLHACAVAEELDILHVVVPRFSGAFSALGLLSADLRRDHMQTHMCRLSEVSEDDLRRRFRKLRDEAKAEMKEIAGGRRIYWEYHADLRYVGQASEVVIPVSSPGRLRRAQVVTAFHRAHRAKFGFSDREAEVELVNIRVTGFAAVDMPELPPPSGSTVADAFPRYEVTLPGIDSCKFVSRDTLPNSVAMEGPIVVAEPTATTFVPPGWRMTMDAGGHLDLRRMDLN